MIIDLNDPGSGTKTIGKDNGHLSRSVTDNMPIGNYKSVPAMNID